MDNPSLAGPDDFRTRIIHGYTVTLINIVCSVGEVMIVLLLPTEQRVDGGNPLVDMVTVQLLLGRKCTCGLGSSVECLVYTTVLRSERSCPVWRCSR